jgi:hypothetical protein
MSSNDGVNGKESGTASEGPADETLRTALNGLSATESGLGFIYSALALLASRYRLSDAVLVLQNEKVGTQIFRLGGKAVSTDFAAQLGDVPGLYCEPRVVPADDIEIVWSACQDVFATQKTRAPGGFSESKNSDTRVEATDAPTRPSGDTRSGRVLTAARTARLVVGDLSRASQRRVAVSRILVVVDLVTLVMTIANTHGSLRFFFGLALGVVIPGWSIVGLIKLRSAAIEIGLTLATSLSLIMIAAQLMMTWNLWHPILLEELTCVVCLPSLLLQSRAPMNRRGYLR